MKFKILAEALTIEGKPCISVDALKILADHKISMELDVIEKGKEANALKPIMVFIHGNSSSKKVFKSQIDHFSKKYHVIAYDLLGHGESTKISNLEGLSAAEMDILCENFYNPCSMIAQTVQLLKFMNVRQAHIIGWSLGGHFGYGVAAEDMSIVASLTTIGSPPICFKMAGFKVGFQDFFAEQVLPEWIKNPKASTEKEAAEIAKAVGFAKPENEHGFFVKDFVTTDPQVRKFLFNNNDTNSSKVLDAFSLLSYTHLPLCVMVGEKDTAMKISYFEEIKNLKNKNSKVVVLKDAPHAIFEHASYLQFLEDFLLSITIAKSNINSDPKSLLLSSNVNKKLSVEEQATDITNAGTSNGPKANSN